MKQSSTLIYSSLVFLLTLILFKVVFLALGSVLVFLIGTTVVEFIWEYRDSPLFLAIVNPIINITSSAVLSLSIYSLIFLPVEYILTEIKFTTPKLPSEISVSLVVLLIIIFSLVNWQNRLKSSRSYLILFLFVFFSSLVYLKYRDEKLFREYLPKIYRYSPKRGIQAEIVKIEGVNFGAIWKKGDVYFGEERMNVVDWGEKRLTLEIPVTGHFGKTELKVLTKEGKISNPVPFEFRDPASLNKIGN